MHNKKTINKNFWIPMIILIVSMIISVAIRQISVVIALFIFSFFNITNMHEFPPQVYKLGADIC